MRALTSAVPEPPGPGDHARGPDTGERIVFWGDSTCPDCAVAALRLRNLPVKVHFRHFAMSSRHRRAVPLATAAEAAGAQGRFWDFHDSLYRDPGHTDDPHLWERCEALGIEVGRFDEDRRSPATASVVRAQTSEALRGGAISTPAFMVNGIIYASLDDALSG